MKSLVRLISSSLAVLLLVALPEKAIPAMRTLCPVAMDKSTRSQDLERKLGPKFMSEMRKYGLTLEVLSETLKYTRKTIATYPPDRFLMINYGPSTSLISSFMRVLLPESVLDSYLAEVPAGLGGWTSDQNRDRWFDKVLPQLKDLHGRDVVITRVLWLGLQISKFAPFFVDYLNDRHFSGRIDFNVVVGKEVDGGMTFSEYNKNRISTSVGPGQATWNFTHNPVIANALVYDRTNDIGDHDFHRFSRYVLFYSADAFLNPDFQLTPNPNYRQLDRLIRTFVNATAP